MYAVFNACGKQYKVKKGDTLQLELLPEALGETTSFTEVLLVGNSGGEVKIGKPLVDKASVKAEVVGIEKGPKIDIVMYKRRKQFKRHIGHRQPYTRILVTEISNGAQSDSLSKEERDAILKRVGFVARDEYQAIELDPAAQEKKIKARGEKQKAKLAALQASGGIPVAAKKKAPGKATGAKKAAVKTKKAPAKKAAKKDE